jgi:predicted TIM-barrel fold metal-dependent hydrolase
MILDRIDRGYQRLSNCPHPPSYYLRRCYFDTACVHGPALECARATWGVNRLVFGTDVPHVPNAEKDTVAALRARSWSDAELGAVFSGTIRNLLA